MNSSKNYYSAKELNYYTTARADILPHVPAGKNKILEIGCGDGATLLKLKKSGKAEEIVGVDLIDLNPPLDNFVAGDLEKIRLPYPDEYFDVLICADVLEHLVDPWKILSDMLNFLRSGGRAIISLPNFQEFKTMIQIFLRGDFAYQEKGVLDKTHLRFFCKKNMQELIRGAGLTIIKTDYGIAPKRKFVNKISLNILENYLIGQFIFVCKKP